MGKIQYMPLNDNVEEMFIGPFGSSLKNDAFVDENEAFCMVYEQKHAIKKTMDVETRYVNREKYEELKRFNIKGGDIIVSCRGTIGETFIVPENAPLGIMHPSIMKIRLKQGVYNKQYFDLLLRNYLKQHEDEANGSGIKMAVSAKELGATKFPVPKMEEQIQVASLFESIENLITLRKQQLTKLDELVKSRFVEMFGDPETNPMKWNKDALQTVSEVRGRVGWKGYQKQDLRDSGPLVLGATHLTNDGNLDLSAPVFLSREKYDESPEIILQVNDLIFTQRGNTIGKVGLIDRDIGEATINPCVLILRPLNINPLFFKVYFLLDSTREDMWKLNSGSAQPMITQKGICNYSMILPPLELQEQFAAFVEQTDKSKFAIRQSLEKLETLKKALMQEYFG